MRRAKRRAEIKEGKRPLVVNSTTLGSLQVSNSLSDSKIKNMNHSVIRSEAYLEASKI